MKARGHAVSCSCICPKSRACRCCRCILMTVIFVSCSVLRSRGDCIALHPGWCFLKTWGRRIVHFQSSMLIPVFLMEYRGFCTPCAQVWCASTSLCKPRSQLSPRVPHFPKFLLCLWPLVTLNLPVAAAKLVLCRTGLVESWSPPHKTTRQAAGVKNARGTLPHHYDITVDHCSNTSQCPVLADVIL